MAENPPKGRYLELMSTPSKQRLILIPVKNKRQDFLIVPRLLRGTINILLCLMDLFRNSERAERRGNFLTEQGKIPQAILVIGKEV